MGSVARLSLREVSCAIRRRELSLLEATQACTHVIRRSQPTLSHAVCIMSFNVQWSRGRSKSLGKFPSLPLQRARTWALAALADAAMNGTPEIAKGAAKALTWTDFKDTHYWSIARTPPTCAKSVLPAFTNDLPRYQPRGNYT